MKMKQKKKQFFHRHEREPSLNDLS